MARKSYGRASSLLNIGTYPDDDSYPVGSNEWNANHSDDGIIGFDKSAQAIASANTVNVTDSFIEITTADSASGGSNDGIYTLAAITTAHSTTNYSADTSNSNVKLRSNASSYSEGDLIYVVKAAGQGATTLRHQQGGAGAGKITTLDGEHKLLSATVPTILMARIISGNVEWVEYGGGAVTVPTTITVADESSDATCFPLFVDTATGDRAPKTGDNFLFNASSGLLTLTGELNAASLDISGSADIDGTLEADAYTVDGTTLAEYISDTVGGMVTGNTETGIAVTYEDGDNTLDFAIGTLNQNTTGTAATVTTAAQTAITSTGTLTGLTMDGAIAMGGNDITNGGVIFLTEQAEAELDVAGKGQIWVDTQTPNKLYFTDDAGTDTDLTAGGGDTFGAQQFWCDGGAFIPTPSSTAGTATSYGQTRVLSNGVSVSSVVLPKNASIDSRCTVTWTPPENWDAGTIKAKIYWTMQNTTTTSVGDTGAFEVAGVAVSNDDTLNASFGTAVAVTDVFLATNDLHVAAISGAITVGGSPANADFVQIRVNRNAGSDTLENGSNVELLGIILEYTQDASTSSG